MLVHVNFPVRFWYEYKFATIAEMPSKATSIPDESIVVYRINKAQGAVIYETTRCQRHEAERQIAYRALSWSS